MGATRHNRWIVSLLALTLALVATSLPAAAQSGSEAVVCVGSVTQTLQRNLIRRIYTEDMEIAYRIGVDIGQRDEIERALRSQLDSHPEVRCAWSDPGEDHVVIISYTSVMRQGLSVNPDDPQFQAFSVGFGPDFDAAETQATTIDQRFSSQNDGSGYEVLLRETWSVADGALAVPDAHFTTQYSTAQWFVLIAVFFLLPLGAFLVSSFQGDKSAPLKGLNLPHGSVRSMLALLVVGFLVVTIAFGRNMFDDDFFRAVSILATLAAAVIGYYFGSRGQAVTRSLAGKIGDLATLRTPNRLMELAQLSTVEARPMINMLIEHASEAVETKKSNIKTETDSEKKKALQSEVEAMERVVNALRRIYET